MDLPTSAWRSLIISAATKKCDGVRIVLGAVAPTPMRAKSAEALWKASALTEALAEKTGDEAPRKSKTDQRRALFRRLSPRHGRRHDQTSAAQRRGRPGQILGRTPRSKILKNRSDRVWNTGVMGFGNPQLRSSSLQSSKFIEVVMNKTDSIHPERQRSSRGSSEPSPFARFVAR